MTQALYAAFRDGSTAGRSRATFCSPIRSVFVGLEPDGPCPAAAGPASPDSPCRIQLRTTNARSVPPTLSNAFRDASSWTTWLGSWVGGSIAASSVELASTIARCTGRRGSERPATVRVRTWGRRMGSRCGIFRLEDLHGIEPGARGSGRHASDDPTLLLRFSGGGRAPAVTGR